MREVRCLPPCDGLLSQHQSPFQDVVALGPGVQSMRNRSPLVITLVAVLAVLGLVSSSGPGPSPTSSSRKETTADGEAVSGDADGASPTDLDHLKPLQDYFGLKERKEQGPPGRAKPRVASPGPDEEAAFARKLLDEIA